MKQNCENDKKIYGYKHWTLEKNSRCFYVGKGLLGRAESHYSRNHKWRAVVKRYGLRIEVCIGPVVNQEACDWEIGQIEKMGTYSSEHSHNVEYDIGCNFTKGGEGTLGRKFSEKTKKQISDSQKGELSVWFGRNHSIDTKLKISNKNNGKLRSKDVKDRISKKLKGKKILDRGNDWRRKISLSNKRRTWIKKLFKKNEGYSHSQQTIVICGGPDRCGKTNILQELEKQTGIKVFKAKNEHENFLSNQKKFIEEIRHSDIRQVDLLAQTGISILIDRSYPCEWVYSQYFKRETDMNVLKALDTAYQKMNARILICTRKNFDGIQDDLDPRLDSNALKEIHLLYMKFVQWTNCNVKVLYVDDEDLNREIKEILEFINESSK